MYTIDSCKAFDMLFPFNFTVNYLQSSNPFLFNQQKRLSCEIFDVLILRDSMENNTRGRIFKNSCRGTSVTRKKRNRNKYYTNK